MGRSTPADHPMREDIDLLITQTERCRAILRQLSSLSSSSEEHMAHLPLLSLVEEVIAPHRDFGVEIRVARGRRDGAEPVLRRNPGILYGLGNIVENAVDFATGAVTVDVAWTNDDVRIDVRDDGAGFTPDVLSRIGDPYVSPREGGPRQFGGNLGLGVFIAKTLLERSGARIVFGNRPEGEPQGALVRIVWPRATLDARRGAIDAAERSADSSPFLMFGEPRL
jgi:two-component system sensor histidine kinase RegB